MRIERSYLESSRAKVHMVQMTNRVQCTGCLNIIYDIICMTHNKYLLLMEKIANSVYK